MEENKIVIYKDENNAIQLDVKLDNGMIWVTRQQLATLFGRDYKTISKHINNALKEELADEGVVAKFANTTQHGAIEGKTQTHEIEYFNLEMVTSVGYRVKSNRGERRLVQELHRSDLSDFRRQGTLSQCGGEGRHVALSRHQEPFV